MELGLFTWFHPFRDGRSEAESFKAAFHEVELADQMGWDTVWLPETHLGKGMILIPNPILLAGAVASRTKNVNVGLAIHQPRLNLPDWAKAESEANGGGDGGRGGRGGGGGGGAPGAGAPGVTTETSTLGRSLRDLSLIPSADPIKTAEDTALVDQVSEGRFIYGVGGGSRGNEHRRAMVMEFLDIVKQAWRERDEFTGYEGKYYQYPKMLPITPGPAQEPGPKIVLASESQTSFKAHGEMGYHILIGAGTAHNRRGHEGMKNDVQEYHDAWHAAGHPGEPQIVVRIPTHVAKTREKAMANVEKTMEFATNTTSRAGVANLPQADPGTQSVQSARDANLFGTPEDAIERIAQLRDELGATGVMFETNYYGQIEREHIIESMHLITEKVFPAFK